MIQLYFLKDKTSNINWFYWTIHRDIKGEYVHHMSDNLGDLIERINTKRRSNTTNLSIPISQYNLIEEFENFDELIQFIHDSYPEECI
ncbi:hypothetical protein [Vibrio phage phiKT1024]|nr:hypothetical protein [Vibrio phage phiKT1024]